MLFKHADLKKKSRQWIISKPLTPQKSSYIMAAIDRVIHHSVILDMMEVESYRVTQANNQRKLQQAAAKVEAHKPDASELRDGDRKQRS